MCFGEMLVILIKFWVIFWEIVIILFVKGYNNFVEIVDYFLLLGFFLVCIDKVLCFEIIICVFIKVKCFVKIVILLG